MKDIKKLPADHYLDLIRTNKPFQLARFGDGEVLAMQLAPHWLKENCDGSKFIPELVQPMRQIFENQYNYYHCLLNCSFDLLGEDFQRFIEETCPNMPFYDGEVWQHLSFEDRINELIEAINPYNPCFIGGKHISNVRYMKGLKSMSFIETPQRDSFYKFNQIFAQVMDAHIAGNRMFLFSTGYTTKPLIDTLFPYIGHDTFLLDMGSVLDPYCGKLSRDGMQMSGFDRFQPYTSMILT